MKSINFFVLLMDILPSKILEVLDFPEYPMLDLTLLLLVCLVFLLFFIPTFLLACALQLIQELVQLGMSLVQKLFKLT